LGRRLAALTWVVALLHAGLGLVVLRQAALLVGVDNSLSTTSAVDELGAGALAAPPLHFTDALDAMGSLEDELLADPGYLFWDADRDTRIGCRVGVRSSCRPPGRATRSSSTTARWPAGWR
jgi:hypothetical protein